MKYSTTNIRITKDKMEAWLYLMPKEDGGQYTKDELYDMLCVNEINKGYLKSNIAAIAKKKVYGREIKVAEGMKSVAGSDGYYEYLVDFEDDKKREPIIREDGSVDYQSMSALCNVKEGDVVARYHPAVPGTEGFNVEGETITVSAHKELIPLKGRGITVKEDEQNTYIATQSGKIIKENSSISIRDVHTIIGDVDLVVGKVEFLGDIVITGNVEAGVEIRAGKSVTIEGNVEAVSIHAGEDIVLKRGVQGGQKAVIVAKRSVYADFIEHSNVKAGEDVHANAILNSKVKAEGKVIIDGKRGCLIGGTTHALKGVSAVNVGNEVEVKTFVHVGCEIEVYQKITECEKICQYAREEIQVNKEETERLNKNKQRVVGKTLMLDRRIHELKEKTDKQLEKLKKAMADKQALSNKVEAGKNANVYIDGHVYRGTIIEIGRYHMPIERSTVYMEYFAQDGMVQGKVILHN